MGAIAILVETNPAGHPDVLDVLDLIEYRLARHYLSCLDQVLDGGNQQHRGIKGVGAIAVENLTRMTGLKGVHESGRRTRSKVRGIWNRLDGKYIAGRCGAHLIDKHRIPGDAIPTDERPQIS